MKNLSSRMLDDDHLLMRWNITNCIILPLTILFMVTLFWGSSLVPISAESPIFSRQEIRDNISDWLEPRSFNYTTAGDKSIDIARAYYLSTGKSLNATLWFAAPLSIEPSNSTEAKSYGMLIDADSNYATGVLGMDYRIGVKWDNKTRTWTKIFDEIESFNQLESLAEKTVLPEIINYTGFLTNGKRYIDLSVDLNIIGPPSSFRVLFYALEKKQGLPEMVDLTNWAYVPPPQFILATIPDPVEINQGEKKDILVQVKSSTTDQPLLVDNFNVQNASDSKIMWNFSKLHQSNNLEPIPVKIKVEDDAKLGTQRVNILAVINAISSFPFTTVESNDSTIEIDTNQQIFSSGRIIADVPLKIKVLEKLSPETRLLNWIQFWNPLITLIVGIGTFVGGILVDRFLLPPKQ